MGIVRTGVNVSVPGPSVDATLAVGLQTHAFTLLWKQGGVIKSSFTRALVLFNDKLIFRSRSPCGLYHSGRHAAIYDIFLRALDNVNCTIKLYITYIYSTVNTSNCSKETVAQRAPYGRDGQAGVVILGRRTGR